MNLENHSGLLDPRGAVGQQLLQILRDLIIENKLIPGERLSEAEIAARYGVSRQPVRETFIRLSDEGLVEIRPQRGTFVCKISLRAVENARFIREAIESDLVRILASRPDIDVIDELRRQLKEQMRLSRGNNTPPERREFLHMDDHFHKTLADAAGRRHLWQILEGVKSQMDRVRYLTTQTLDIDRLVGQHSAVINAIEASDPFLAEHAMRQHLRTILDDLNTHQNRTPGIFEGLENDQQGMLRVSLSN